MNAILDFYGILGFFTIGQLLILVIYLFYETGGSSELKISFLLILGVIGFVSIHDTLVHTRLILYAPQLTFHGESFSLLIWPFIYFYIRIAFGRKIIWLDALHLLPFLLYQCNRLDLILLPASEKLQLLESYYFSIDSFSTKVVRQNIGQVFFKDFLLYRLQPLLYIGWILLFLSGERKRNAGRDFKYPPSKHWIQLIFLGYFLIWLTRYLHYLGGFFFPKLHTGHPFQIVFLSFQVVLLTMLLLKSSAPPSKVFYKKTLDGVKQLHEKFERQLQVEKIYLDPGLNMKMVADLLKTNSKYVSILSNEYFKCSFTDLINQYRVEEAKRLLADPANRQFTIETISRQAGFRSVATFNRAFKKMEEITPSQYLMLINS